MNKIDDSSSCCNHYFNDNSSVIPKTNRTTTNAANYNINDMFYNSNNFNNQAMNILNETVKNAQPHTTRDQRMNMNMTLISFKPPNESINQIEKEIEEQRKFQSSHTTAEKAVAKLQGSNEKLLKENYELKSMCLLLEKELSSIKTHPSFQSPYSQYDIELNEFISNLKQALNCSQASNQELHAMIKEKEKQCEELYSENSQIVQLFNSLKIKYQSKGKELCELKSILSSKEMQLEKYITHIEELNNKIASQDSQLSEKETEIKKHLTITSSKLQFQNDTEETLNQLKQTIDSYQKSNAKQIEKNSILQKQFDMLKHTLLMKEDLIGTFKNTLYDKEKEEDKLIREIEELKALIKQHKMSFTNKQDELRIEYGEKAKLKTQIESLQLFIEDRERTICTLKESLSILTKTFDIDLSAIKVQSKEEFDVQKYINDNVNELKAQVKQLEIKNEEQLMENNTLISEFNCKQKEIEELITQYDELKYEYQLLYQTYKEQSILLEQLKNDFMHKQTDTELIDLIKANEEILTKLRQIEEDNKVKTKELRMLKSSNSKLSFELIETQRLLTASVERSIDNSNRKGGFLTLSSNTNQEEYNKCEINELEESTSTQQLDSLLNNNNTTAIGNYLFYTTIEGPYAFSFNLQSKQFRKIQYQDRNDLFINNYDSSISTKLNISNGLLVISDDKVFSFHSLNNTIELIAQLNYSHRKASAICVNQELYIVSGEKTRRCEKVSIKLSSITDLPSVNYERTEGGLCNVDNKYLYALFGNCEQRNASIERLNVNDLSEGWELMKYHSADTFLQNGNISNFICISGAQKIMIMGGITQQGIVNYSLIQYDYHNGVITSNEESKCLSLFNDQSIQIEDNLYINIDIEGNAHVFDTIFSFYKVYKFKCEDEK